MWRRIIALLVIGSSAWAASPCASGLSVCKVTVRASGGDYTMTNLQTAVNDAATWQGTTCAPYVIEVNAGLSYSAVGGLTLPAKTCAQYVEIRSSSMTAIGDRVVAADLPSLFTLTIPALDGGPSLSTVSNSKTKYWAVRGANITCTSPCSNFGLVFIGNLSESLSLPDKPSYITLDKSWVHGIPMRSGVVRPVALICLNCEVKNSRLEDIPEFYADSQGVLTADADNVRIENNFIGTASENVFTGSGYYYYPTSHILTRGNQLENPTYMHWTYGNVAPTGACFADERYTHFNATYAGGVNATVANNGSGLIRVTQTAHGLTTGTTIQTPHVQDGCPNTIGVWVITVIDANTYDLQGSTFDATCSIYATKINGLYACSGNVWVSTGIATWGADWHWKNMWETKGGSDLTVIGNTMNYQHGQEQYESIIINNIETGANVGPVTVVGNKMLNEPQVMRIGNGNYGGYVHGITKVRVSDNLAPNVGWPWPRIGGYGLGTANCTDQGMFTIVDPYYYRNVNQSPIIGTNYVPDLAIRHNTMLYPAPASCGGGILLGTTNYAMLGNFTFSDNIFSNMTVYNLTGMGPDQFCGMQQSIATGGSLFSSKNILSTVENGGSPTFVDGAACPNANFPTTWTSTTNYTGAFTSSPTVAGNYTDGDLHCAGTFAKCVSSATDHTDVGADVDMVNWMTANTSSGVRNKNLFDFEVKGCTTTPSATTTATCYYVAPSTSACTLVVSSNEDYSSPDWNASDGGGNPARMINVTGLSGKRHMMKVTCGSASRSHRSDYEKAVFLTL